MRVGEEVDALSYKTDVGARVGDYVDEKKQAVTSRLSGAKDVAQEADPRPRADAAGQGPPRSATHSGSGWARQASGSSLGLLLPTTRLEDEKLGPASDKVGEVAREGSGARQAGGAGERSRPRWRRRRRALAGTATSSRPACRTGCRARSSSGTSSSSSA